MKLSVSIPTSLNEITLRQYKELLKIQENAENETHLHAKIIQILCNMNISDVMLLKASDCQIIVEKLTKLFDEKPELVTTFKLNKTNYGFIPQLDEISLGEYIDLDTFIGDWDNIEKAMNVLYRPIVLKSKEKYTIDEYKLGTDDLLLDMPMNAVLSSIFFLWNLGLDLSKAMMNYLDQKEYQALTHNLISMPNMGGINQFSDLLKATLEDLKISLN
tara:strand:+ start:401 stop:1051 length:651 start_codon:yes stop_codon:yes gene_type:complete